MALAGRGAAPTPAPARARAAAQARCSFAVETSAAVPTRRFSLLPARATCLRCDVRRVRGRKRARGVPRRSNRCWSRRATAWILAAQHSQLPGIASGLALVVVMERAPRPEGGPSHGRVRRSSGYALQTEPRRPACSHFPPRQFAVPGTVHTTMVILRSASSRRKYVLTRKRVSLCLTQLAGGCLPDRGLYSR